jgi:type IV pilus assembly protein PilO
MALPAWLDPVVSPLLNASRVVKLLLGAIVLAGLGAACYVFAIEPVESRVTALRGQRAAQEQELTRLRAIAAELVRMRREAAEVERQLDIAKAKLPTEREMPALYRTLSDAAVQAGLAVALFQPQASRTRDFYNEIPIALVAEGGYHDVGDFVGRVAKLPRAATIGELKLMAPKPEAARPTPAPRAPDAGPREPTPAAGAKTPPRPVRAEITLLTFVYRPVGSPPAPKPAAPGAKADAVKP